MSKLMSTAVLCVLIVPPLQAQPEKPPSASSLVKNWYRQFLRRDPDPDGQRYWVRALRDGQDPDRLLARFVTMDEYFKKAGGKRESWVASLYQDLTGREPTSRQTDYWMRKLDRESYKSVAYRMIRRLAGSR